MGANTYIGNAPNFMVKAIAEERGVRMPSFFGYMAWSCAMLVPLFVADDLHLVPLKGLAMTQARRPRRPRRRSPTSSSGCASTSTSRTTPSDAICTQRTS